MGVLVWGLIIWSIVRYRRRSDDVPNQSPYNIPIEIVYTVCRSLIVAVLFFFTMRTQSADESDGSKQPDVIVNVIGFQWQWQFALPDRGRDGHRQQPRTAGPSWCCRSARPSSSTCASADVEPLVLGAGFLSKRDLIPGIDNQHRRARRPKPGTFVGRCAEFCGLDHWRMNFAVRVVSARPTTGLARSPTQRGERR